MVGSGRTPGPLARSPGSPLVLSVVNSAPRSVHRRQLPSPKVLVETDDLLDANEVAELLGLANRTAISVYRSRYPDFPEPVVIKAACWLWLRGDIETWRHSRT
jgi:predicted DNA-binding transcriptional regulator AlpA